MKRKTLLFLVLTLALSLASGTLAKGVGFPAWGDMAATSVKSK